MATNNLPPIPQDAIGENIRWREWFRNLGDWIQSIQYGTYVLPVNHGGTGTSSLSGYLKGNGTSPVTGTPTIPATDITGLATVATSGNYNDLTNNPTTLIWLNM